MKQTIATVAVTILLALPAGAAEQATANIEHFGSTPKLERTSVVDGVRFDAVGQFLHVQVDGGEIQMVRIPRDAVAVAIATDGSVSFTQADEQVDTPPPLYETPQYFEDIYARWRTLHPNTIE